MKHTFEIYKKHDKGIKLISKWGNSDFPLDRAENESALIKELLKGTKAFGVLITNF
jgi:hypothetical protein